MNQIVCWKLIYILACLKTQIAISFKLASLFIPEKDARMSLTEYVESRGYRVEHHRVVTEDGYISALYRIIEDNNPEPTENLKPVILNHGVSFEPGTFLVNSPYLHSNTSRYGDNPGFSLVLTQRYDVWLPESRGQSHSLGHVNMSWLQRDFWEFQWDTMALYELPAIISYVQQVTGRKHIAYIGYSQGTLEMFTLMSIRPEYADIVQPYIALAPAAYLYHPKGLSRKFAPLAKLSRFIDYFLPAFLIFDPCQMPVMSPFCYLLMSSILGFSDRQNMSRFPVYYSQLQGKVSSYNTAYYLQSFGNDGMNRFDYGMIGNLRHYGQLNPPAIHLENIPKHAKIALFYGADDDFFQEKNRKKLLAKFNEAGIKLILDFMISDPDWCHTDFVFGADAGKFYIDRMIDVLDQYSF